MSDILEVLKTIPQLGVDSVLALLVYLLWREVKEQKAIIIECLNSGGKLSDETIDSLDNKG